MRPIHEVGPPPTSAMRSGRPNCSRKVFIGPPALKAWSREILVHERDRHAALPDACCDALDGAMPHVAGRKDARQARLQQIRIALQHPVALRLREAISDIASGAHISPLIANDGRSEE